jgi:hypothetical protein
MSKAMSTTTQQALAAQRENMGERLAGLSTGESIQRIRQKNRTFLMPDGSKIPKELTVVVLDWAYNYQYYSKPYVEGEATFPDCIAVGQTQREMVPSENSPNIQNNGNPCATCPHNQFGSRGNGKACQNRISLGCMLYDDEHGPEDGLFIISVSPTALKNWGKYNAQLAEKGLVPAQVVTVVGFDPNAAYDTLTFAADRTLTKEYHDEEYIDEYVEYIDKATQMVLSEPKPPAEDNG